MPYITQIEGATVDVEADTPIITLPPTGVLNSFGTSTQFSSYNVLDDENDETTETGDYLAPVIGDSPLPGTYQGGVTFSNAQVVLGPVAGISVNLTVNPISGNYFVSEDGRVFIITENPLDNANITVSGAIVTALPPSNTPLVNLSLTELVANPVVAPLLPPGGVNGLLNGVIVTQAVDLNADLILGPGQINDLVCFVAGTLILTPHGYRSVENLKVGDLVSTKDNGDKAIRWIGSRKLSSEDLRNNPALNAIRIKAGALGAGVPSSDLLVSPQHRLLVKSKIAIRMFGTNEVLVAAKQLLCIDGIDIADDLDAVEYFHFLFDQHEVVIANGTETESLYTGAQAIANVGKAAAEEIFALFPELRFTEHPPLGARMLVSGRLGRKLAMRHTANMQPLVV